VGASRSGPRCAAGPCECKLVGLRVVVGHEPERALLEGEDAIGHDGRVELRDAEKDAEPVLVREGVRELASMKGSTVAEGVEQIIDNEKLGTRDDRSGKAGQHALPARQGLRTLVRDVAGADALERLAGHTAHLCAPRTAPAAHRERKPEVVEHGQAKVGLRAIQPHDVATEQLCALAPGTAGEVDAVEEHLAVVGELDAGRQPQQRRLALPTLADDRDGLLLLYLERHILQDQPGTPALPISHAHIPACQQASGTGGRSRRTSKHPQQRTPKRELLGEGRPASTRHRCRLASKSRERGLALVGCAASMLTLGGLLRLWRARLSSRAMLVQEALAVVGIAVGVALLFASQVAATSLGGSVRQLSNEIIGRSQQLQVDARGPGGFDGALLGRVSRLAGVRGAAPVLEQSATVIGRKGSRAVDLLGTTPQFLAVGGPVLRHLSTRELAHVRAIALPQPIAEGIGASALEPIKIQVGARVVHTLVALTLSERQIGALVGSPVALTPIAYAQGITGMAGRLSRIFVRVAAGQKALVERELAIIAREANLNVEPGDFDSKLFTVASSPEAQSETLFSVISALVGFLFAFTAILLTVPRRRKHIEGLWPHGAGYGITFEILLFDAAVLAVLGCVLGLVLGDALSLAAFDRAPGYLASAFPVGNSRIITARSVILAVLAGSASAVGGVLWPMRELLFRTPTQPSPRWATVSRLLTAAICATVTTIVLVARPQDAFLGSVTLIIALLALMPTAFHAVLIAFERVQRSIGGAATELAVDSLHDARVRVRALAIAVLSGVAVFGTISIGGAEASLQRGLDSSANAVSFSASIWVSPSGQASPLSTTPFTPTSPPSFTRLPGVASVGVYRGSFFDWGQRRVWVLAPPANSRAPIPAEQLVSGRLGIATRRIRAGGWAVLSQALAHENHLTIGDSFTLPSPVPTRLRVAALTTNLGWPPGAVILNTTEYARAWASNAPSAYEIQTQTGAPLAATRNAVQQHLNPNEGLTAETSTERRARDYAVIDQGLSRLTQIKLLVLLASGLALAGAMTSLIWQRRERIAAIRVQGYTPLVLWQWLCIESILMLATGCCTGAIFGIAGQLLLSHTLAAVTGFPISLHTETTTITTSFAWATALTLTIITVPGTIAAQTTPRTTSATT
jgi:putative ABC transport system permease protein